MSSVPSTLDGTEEDNVRSHKNACSLFGEAGLSSAVSLPACKAA